MPPEPAIEALIEVPDSRWRRLLTSRAFYVLLAIVLGGIALGAWLRATGGVAGLRARFGLLSIALVIPLHVVVAISPAPSELVAFGSGAVYGFWLGTTVSWVAWMLSALLHYALVRRTAADVDLAPLLARLPRWLRRFPVEHPAFLILTRYLPYGPQLVSTIAGVYRVSILRFAACQAIAILPVALFFSGLANRLVGS